MNHTQFTEIDRADAIIDWFHKHGRSWPWRTSRDRWVVLVCEVCSQQTQITRAAPFIERILARFGTPAELAAAPLGELLELWQGLGYPRRARNLWLTAGVIAEHGWPEDLTELPGVGPYTDAAVRCFADEEPVLPLDINTRRVLARVFPEPDVVPDAQQHKRLTHEAWAWGQGVMELGQTSCRAKAQCDSCPITQLCPSSGTTDVIASPRQARYEGSMRQRRGRLLRAIAQLGVAHWDDDTEAADSLVADGLAIRAGMDGELLLPPTGHEAPGM
jgi:A/G-specific adenine glycosylase